MKLKSLFALVLALAGLAAPAARADVVENYLANHPGLQNQHPVVTDPYLDRAWGITSRSALPSGGRASSPSPPPASIDEPAQWGDAELGAAAALAALFLVGLALRRSNSGNRLSF